MYYRGSDEQEKIESAALGVLILWTSWYTVHTLIMDTLNQGHNRKKKPFYKQHSKYFLSFVLVPSRRSPQVSLIWKFKCIVAIAWYPIDLLVALHPSFHSSQHTECNIYWLLLAGFATLLVHLKLYQVSLQHLVTKLSEFAIIDHRDITHYYYSTDHLFIQITTTIPDLPTPLLLMLGSWSLNTW